MLSIIREPHFIKKHQFVFLSFFFLLHHAHGQQQCFNRDNLCQFWADVGECRANFAWMAQNCPISCRTCPSQQQQPQFAPPRQAPPPPLQFNNPQRCLAIQSENGTELSQLIWREKLAIPFEVTNRRIITFGEVQASNSNFGCVPTQGGVDCGQNTCFNMLFRTMDGTCNNLIRPTLGSSFMPYLRLRPPVYDDGRDAPVSSFQRFRPSARDISSGMISSGESVSSGQFNSMVMQWGQLITHDVAKTTLLPNNCQNCGDVPGRCFSIPVGPFDRSAQVFGPCIRTARSSPQCQSSPRSQANENTAFIDGSPMYGSSEPDMRRFRDGGSGFMRVEFSNGGAFMPRDFAQSGTNFLAGDDRVNVFVGLTAIQTMLLREHNRIANILSGLNRQWDGDRLYHETRKIVGAEIQAITYKEWLPKILGDAMIGAYSGYNSNVDPSISAEFTSTAMRFGHGMIQEFFGNMRFGDGINQAGRIFEGVDNILRSMTNTPVKLPQRITTSVTERMFGNQDLAALDIHRGRDFGIQNYNVYREFCSLPRANSFEDLGGSILNPSVRAGLQQAYGSVDNVDLFAGAILEDPVRNGMVGQTFSCLLADQFRRLRDGDRFFYQNPGIFTSEQLAELEKVTLARLLCDNGENFGNTPTDAFRLGERVTCNAIPAMNLNAWADT